MKPLQQCCLLDASYMPNVPDMCVAQLVPLPLNCSGPDPWAQIPDHAMSVMLDIDFTLSKLYCKAAAAPAWLK
jgi:hypothetical protein